MTNKALLASRQKLINHPTNSTQTRGCHSATFTTSVTNLTMSKFQSIAFCISVLIGCQSCRIHSTTSPPHVQKDFAAKEKARQEEEQRERKAEWIAEWITTNKILPASEADITQARSTEVPLVNHKADSPYGRVRVVFHLGELKEHRSVGNGEAITTTFTTTSYYQLIDTRSGKALARVQSKLPNGMWAGTKEDQKVCFSPDGHTALIYESQTEECMKLGTYALLSFHPDDSSWSLKYLDPPDFPGQWYDTDPSWIDTVPPAGLLGDTIVYNPLSPRLFHKIKISDVPVGRPPFPFTIN